MHTLMKSVAKEMKEYAHRDENLYNVGAPFKRYAHIFIEYSAAVYMQVLKAFCIYASGISLSIFKYF